jgi:hypothetical protein
MGWRVVSGEWSFEPGYVEHTVTSQLYAGMQRIDVEPDGDLAVEAGFTFAAWDAVATNGRLGVWVDNPDGDPDGGQMCVFNLYSSSGADSIQQQERVGDGGSALRRDIPTLQPGDELVISMLRRRNPQGLQCHGIINGVRYDAPDVTASVAWPLTGHVAVSAGSASAKLRYVVTYLSN